MLMFPLHVSSCTRRACTSGLVGCTSRIHSLACAGLGSPLAGVAGMWENTVLWLTTDNGGMADFKLDDSGPTSASSNWPLRAGKATLFEGGVSADPASAASSPRPCCS